MKSSDIYPVSFRQILFLPLILTPCPDKSAAKCVKEIAASLTRAPDSAAQGGGKAGTPALPVWKEITNRLAHLGSPENASPAFAEFVYFHPYIQRFLYGACEEKQDDARAPLRIFTRDGLPRSDATSAAVKPEDEVPNA